MFRLSIFDNFLFSKYLEISFDKSFTSIGFDMEIAIKTPTRILGMALRKLFKNLSLDLRLETIYLSRLNIIKLQKMEAKYIKTGESKIIENAKYEEIKAKIAVKKIVAPILIYLITSNLGHFEIISRLAPEQKRKNFDSKLNLLIFSKPY
mgnify:CR=1 FL=1|tara:strand:+ start:25 stop:474 length:450 start_codon:yes stop_codon:yes gene_type:complete